MEIKLNGNGPLIVVDDDRDALRLAEIVFQESEVQNKVVLLDSGAKLLQYLEDVCAAKAEMPCIVLLDINMPDCSGFEVLRMIRSREQFRAMPIIVMLTASNDAEDIARSVQGGANGYQVKPFELEEFIRFANSLVPEAC